MRLKLYANIVCKYFIISLRKVVIRNLWCVVFNFFNGKIIVCPLAHGKFQFFFKERVQNHMFYFI
jgi:hypothetical protein